MELKFDIGVHKGICTINGTEYNVVGENSLQSLACLISNYLYERNSKLHGAFNKSLYWPEEVQIAVAWAINKRYEIGCTDHFHERAEELSLPKKCYRAALFGEVVEAEFSYGVVTKIVTRIRNHKNQQQDICMAVRLGVGQNSALHATVLTAWTNRRDDNHQTLHVENYVKEM